MATKEQSTGAPRYLRSPKELRAALQRHVEKSSQDFRFTQGAAEYLAAGAVRNITERYRRPEYDRAYERAVQAFPGVLEALAGTDEVSDGRLTKRETQKLREREVFCNTEPWC